MSLHVAPPVEALAVGPRAAAGRNLDALPGLPLPTEPISVRLGHMGVVIAVSAPGQSAPAPDLAGAVEADPVDTIQLHADPSHLSRLAGVLDEEGGRANGLSRSSDPVIRRLTRALGSAERSDKEFGGVYADALRLAIMARLLGADANVDDCAGEAGFASPDEETGTETARPSSRPRSGLPKWRFKRVAAYVEENLADTVTLADMASAAGLSRMHFAAQFRIATGMRPHEYLLRQRIERAQKMLLERRDTLVEIALGVGFQTQAHFTTVFRRFVGDTPYQWRCANRARD